MSQSWHALCACCTRHLDTWPPRSDLGRAYRACNGFSTLHRDVSHHLQRLLLQVFAIPCLRVGGCLSASSKLGHLSPILRQQREHARVCYCYAPQQTRNATHGPRHDAYCGSGDASALKWPTAQFEPVELPLCHLTSRASGSCMLQPPCYIIDRVSCVTSASTTRRTRPWSCQQSGKRSVS